MNRTIFSNRLFAGHGFYYGLTLALLLLFCLNVAALSIFGSYDIRLGFLHVTAHGLFKPILMMNGCFLLALVIGGITPVNERKDPKPGFAEDWLRSPVRFGVVLLGMIAALVMAIYIPSISVNFSHHDWTHRHISAGIKSVGSAWGLFTKPQADGFYRPLTFLSLWLDYRLFGTLYAGYHLQSIMLHILNSLLAAWLATRLGFSRMCSLWTGLLFAAAAVNFEPVLWPAARFDLLSAMFTLLALIFAIGHFRDSRKWTWALPAALLCYTIGIMNKESSYCFPLLLVFILATRKLWSIPWPGKAKTAICLFFVAADTILMVLVRIAVYGNLGGYPAGGAAQSPHFQVGFRTFTSLLRAVCIPIFGVNTTSAAPGWIRIAVVVFVVLIFAAAMAGRGSFNRTEYALAACGLLASAPVLNIVGWIATSMQHSRYLYLPSAFFMLLLASALGKIRKSFYLLGAFLALNAAGAVSNIAVYETMLARTKSLANEVRGDWIRHQDVRAIYLVDLPESPNGVFYFAPELIENIGRAIPDVKIFRQDAPGTTVSEAEPRLIYRWTGADQLLRVSDFPTAPSAH